MSLSSGLPPSNRPWRRITRLLAGLGRDCAGVSAVEFALIAPLMLLFYYGSFEVSSMLMADRKIKTATASIGDLVARSPSVTGPDMDDIFTAADLIVAPYDQDRMSIQIVSFVIENEGDPVEVDWTYSNANWKAANGPFDPGSDAAPLIAAMPSDVMPSEGGLIMARIAYDYEAPLGFLFDGAITIADRFYMRPRRTDTVEFN